MVDLVKALFVGLVLSVDVAAAHWALSSEVSAEAAESGVPDTSIIVRTFRSAARAPA